jgi:hypothetical protein
VEFFDKTYKNKKELCTIYKNCQNFAPLSLFNAQMTPQKMQGIQIVIVFTFFVDYLANWAFLTLYVLGVLCLFLIIKSGSGIDKG